MICAASGYQMADGVKEVRLLGSGTAMDWCLVGNTEGKRMLRRPSYRWENDTKMCLQEVDWDGVDLADLAQNRDNWWAVVNTVMKLLIP
jgi:hypothetical protein